MGSDDGKEKEVADDDAGNHHRNHDSDYQHFSIDDDRETMQNMMSRGRK